MGSSTTVAPHTEVGGLLDHGNAEGFSHWLTTNSCCRSSTGNTPSAIARSEVVSSFLMSQSRAGYMLGPLPPESCQGVVTSHMAVIPKKVPGKWRVMVDLSSPHDSHSVNDNLHRHLSHVSYSSTDDAAMLMHFLGPVTLQLKLIYRVHICRLVPIHPADRHFLGLSWQGSVVYVDC